jgi:uncharacterized Ntn-hydrolase superfamily protein
MNNTYKNKLLTWLLVVLLLANAITIALFWIGRNKPFPPPQGSPADFLIKELNMDSRQQEQYKMLVKEHQDAVRELREKIKAAKDSLFVLMKKDNVSDSSKKEAAHAVSRQTEQLDILTLEHFQKVRALCNKDQQKKFDDIIHEVIRMMAQPGPPVRRDIQGPPPPR